jgi:hypothetical protein
MNLLNELKPFAAQLDHYKQGYGITDTIAINKLADIWDRFADTRKKEIYGSDTVIIPKTKTSCASCIKDMMNMLVNWRRIVEGEGGDLVEFKSVKQANVTEVEANKPEATIGTIKINWRHIRMNVGDPMTYGEAVEKFKGEKLEAIVKDCLINVLGIKPHHKMKLPKLLELLNG